MDAIMRLKTARNPEQIAVEFEPLAQAMAALVDETRQTLAAIQQESKEQAEMYRHQVEMATASWIKASQAAQTAADRLDQAGARMELRHYALAVIIGITTAALVTASLLWLAPSPAIRNEVVLDAAKTAEYLRTDLIEAIKRK